MEELIAIAERVGARLKQRGETIAVAESSTGGLISAALLAVPGASAYFIGGGVIYTGKARAALLGLGSSLPDGMRPSTEPYAMMLARTIRHACGTTWGVAETGATGPTGNRYGDAPGHSCIAIAGPADHAVTLETGKADRVGNMHLFAARALDELAQMI